MPDANELLPEDRAFVIQLRVKSDESGSGDGVGGDTATDGANPPPGVPARGSAKSIAVFERRIRQ